MNFRGLVAQARNPKLEALRKSQISSFKKEEYPPQGAEEGIRSEGNCHRLPSSIFIFPHFWLEISLVLRISCFVLSGNFSPAATDSSAKEVALVRCGPKMLKHGLPRTYATDFSGRFRSRSLPTTTIGSMSAASTSTSLPMAARQRLCPGFEQVGDALSGRGK